MFYHLILGFLRDGRSRHAYDLISEYRSCSARPVNAGNIYRECGKLVSQGLIATDENPAEADPRRIPYRITENGRREFDSWLLEPEQADGSLSGWVLFADMLPPGDRLRLVDRMQEQLWMENKTLVRARESLLARGRRLGSNRYRPGAFVLLRRIKQTTADLEFLEELRRELEQAPSGRVTVISLSRSSA